MAQLLQNVSSSNKSHSTEVNALNKCSIKTKIWRRVELMDRDVVTNNAIPAGVDLSLVESIAKTVVNTKSINFQHIIKYAINAIWKGTFKNSVMVQVWYAT